MRGKYGWKEYGKETEAESAEEAACQILLSFSLFGKQIDEQ